MLKSRSDLVRVTASDGVELRGRLYRPIGPGPWPTLFAASPYRFDNDDIPETCTFLWRETGPIDWYVDQGYAYLHLDVRGSGRSGGDYGFFDAPERRDLYDVIEWIAQQPWSTGKVGGIGHSYYATTQWCMASERPPHLACIAPYDGHCDIYRGWAYHGGVPCNFLVEWWCNNVRPINLHPLDQTAPQRDISRDLVRDLSLHPIWDAFWAERSFADSLTGCEIPLLSIGVWSKLDLHLTGNIEGYQRFAGTKNLLITGAPHMSAAQADFESVEFHQRHLLPFYDRHLKGVIAIGDNDAPISFALRGTGEQVSVRQWPPSTETAIFYLSPARSGAAGSLNDGTLDQLPVTMADKTSYTYPDPHWSLGNVEFTPTGIDPLSRNLTFASTPLESGLEMSGEAELTVTISSTRTDTDIIVKLVEQFDGDGSAPPRSVLVSKGWLRASHREIEDRTYGLRHRHDRAQPLAPNKPHVLSIALVATAYSFTKGSRIRLDLSCADSPVTDNVFGHLYTPDKVGTDTLHFGTDIQAMLTLPLLDRSSR